MHRLAGARIALSLLLISFWPASVLLAEDYPAAWKLAHPDAKALAGINIRALSDSQVVQKFKNELEASPQFAPSQLPVALSMNNIQILKEIDQVFISSPGAKTADLKGEAKGAPQQNPPVLVVVNGRFTPESLAQIFKGTPRVYHSVEIYASAPGTTKAAASGAHDTSMSMAKLNATTLLMGDDASLRGAIDRSVEPSGGIRTKAQIALLERASNMAATHDFWIIATVSPSAFQPANLSLGKILSDVRGFDIGLSLQNGFSQELSVAMTTPALAHEMAQQFSTQLQLAAAANLGTQDSADLLKKFAVTSEGARIGLKISLTQEELDRAIHTAQSNRQKAAMRSPVMIERPKTIEQPQTIKIYGLDDGVREIPMAAR